jgi:hypothetical protein
MICVSNLQMENEDPLLISTLQKKIIGLKKAHFGQNLFPKPCPKDLKHLWDSNSQMGNPLGNVGIHFLAISHICGRVFEF